MDLTYSAADEAFRSELREWFTREVPAYGPPPPPPPGDWPARRAYDTGWQRRLHDAGYAGLNWPVEFGGRGLPASQQLVFLEEYAACGAPYVGINFVGNAHAGPTLIAEGTDEQRSFHARIEALWYMTRRCVTEAEATGVPSPLGSAVKLGYSELGQELSTLGMKILGRRILGSAGHDSIEAMVVLDYLWSFQYTIAAGTSQIQRNLIAERILGMPKGRVA